MSQLDTFVSLRPDVASLDPADKAALRREIFDTPTADAPRLAKVAPAQPSTSRRPRWLPAAAAAALVVIGGVGLWAAGSRQPGGTSSDTAPPASTTNPPTPVSDGSVDEQPTTPPTAAAPTAPATATAGDEPAWYEPVHALLPPGFDYVGVRPAEPTSEVGPDEGQVLLVALNPALGFVLEITITAKPNMADIGGGETFIDDAGSYFDVPDGTTLVTPDRRWVDVRCGTALSDGLMSIEPSRALSFLRFRYTCEDSGGPTTPDRRALAARLAAAFDVDEMRTLFAAVESDREAATSMMNDYATSFGGLADEPTVRSDDWGWEASVGIRSQPDGDITTEFGVLAGVCPKVGDAAPVTRRLTIDLTVRPARVPPLDTTPGTLVESSVQSGPTRKEIATVTLIRGGYAFLAVTTDVADDHLVELQGLVAQAADLVAKQ